MNRRRIGRLVVALISSLGLAGTGPFLLGGLPSRQY
jgi:hypothetical protein